MTLHRTTAWSAGALVAVVTAGVLAGTGPSQAADVRFGQHVRHCAQSTGFDGMHNPGMHAGASEWHVGHAGC